MDDHVNVPDAAPSIVPAPAGRRPAIDVARVLALVLVVLGHLALAVIDVDDGDLRATNLLELRPSWAWLTVLAPMPVFFAAAGWANATGTLRTSAGRLAALVGAGALVVVAWSIGVIVTTWVNGEPGLSGRAARVATQPLWFLAAYVPFAAGGARLARLVHRRPGLVGAAMLAVLAVLDLARFAGDLPDWIGWIGFALAWGVPWLLGSWWRDRVDHRGIHERRVGLTLAVAAGVAAAFLAHGAGYSVALIDAVPGARSNTTPPTLYTAVAGIAQVGVLMLIAGVLDRLGERWPGFWRRAGTAAVGVYVWHLTALMLCAGVIALGAPAPERLTGLWWATRPLWWVAVLGVTALVAATFGRIGAGGHRTSSGTGSVRLAALGVVTATAGAALVGLEGPRSVPLALACSGLFLCARVLLGRGPGQPQHDR